MKRIINLAAGLILLVCSAIFLTAIAFRVFGVYYNNTPSFPVGFYKIIDEPVGKGAYVSFCPPQNKVFDMAMARYYISSGDCLGGYGKLLKRVFAQAGDRVSIDAAGIVVNGSLLPNSAQISLDSNGRELPQYKMKQRILDHSELLLISDLNPHSFDARYFGLIPALQIQHVVEPLFTWE